LSPDLLRHILVRELDAKEEGSDSLTLSDRTTFLLAGPEGLVAVAKVSSVQFKDGFISLIGEEGRFFCEEDKVFGIRAELDHAKSDKRPGFH